jgi:hypothetical protein
MAWPCSASQTISGRSSEASDKRQRRDPELEEEEEQEDAPASMEMAAHAHLPLAFVKLKVKQQVLQLPFTPSYLKSYDIIQVLLRMAR